MDSESKSYTKVEEEKDLPNTLSHRKRGRPFRFISIAILLFFGISLLTVVYGISREALQFIFLPAFVLSQPFTFSIFMMYKTSKRASVHYMRKFGAISFFVMSFFASLLATVYFSPFVLRFDYLWNLSKDDFPVRLAAPLAVFLYFYLCVWIQLCALARPKLRSLLYRLIISWPATIFYSTIVLSLLFLPWVSLLNFAHEELAAYVMLVPPSLAVIGIFQSLINSPWVEVDIDLRESLPSQHGSGRKFIKPERLNFTTRKISMPPRGIVSAAEQNIRRVDNFGDKSIRIVQITDPHLGPFVSVARLKNICEDAAKLDPDYVFLTGDYYTLESEYTPGCLYEALKPLKVLADQGKVFACHGNHDIDHVETEEMTLAELRKLGAKILVDESIFIGDQNEIQLIGSTFNFNKRQHRIRTLCEKASNDSKNQQRQPTRIMLLHNPMDFQYLPEDENLLVFSGHTHGGMLGLISLGLKGTFVALFGPDHGLWHFNGNRLYVHRGQGTRFLNGNFLTRLGVSNELSVVNIIGISSRTSTLNINAEVS